MADRPAGAKLARPVRCFELPTVCVLYRLPESVRLHFVFCQLCYVVVCNVQLALANIAAVLAPRVVGLVSTSLEDSTQ